ncbi:MAG: polyphosphate polymerase domain-containing protein [Candidatus Gracilibacteria bacterium]|nr:polyphosphate polymerase domain-containing protein [Candidatus Gracilibacteria bacterium]
MGTDLNTSLKTFNQITLTQLNSQASFLNRIDTKYILTEAKFKEILKDLEEDFFILEIKEKSIFEYESIYMDTYDFHFYYQHQNGQKNRTKVRTRNYLDSDMVFFEYKQKQKGVTRKFRYKFDSLNDHGKMTNESTKFFEGAYQSFYSESPEKIFPSLATKYNRITFCSKTNDERLTIDFNIRLEDLRNDGKAIIDLDNLVIIESKSMSKDGKSSRIMKKHDIKKSGSCSKYSLGLCYQKMVDDTSKFKPTMKKINKIRESE